MGGAAGRLSVGPQKWCRCEISERVLGVSSDRARQKGNCRVAELGKHPRDKSKVKRQSVFDPLNIC